MEFQSNHLLGLDGTSAEDIVTILDTAKSFQEISLRPVKKVPALHGKTVANLLYTAKVLVVAKPDAKQINPAAEIVFYPYLGAGSMSPGFERIFKNLPGY